MNLSLRVRNRSGNVVHFLGGFTLVELMVSVVIMSVAVATAVQLSNIALSGGRGNASAEVRNLIRRDLNWLKWFSKDWNCTAGCKADTANSLLVYKEVSCTNLPTSFLDAADKEASKPFPVVIGNRTLQSVNGAKLDREITLSGYNLLIKYTYPGQPPIDRFSSVRIQAAESCTSP